MSSSDRSRAAIALDRDANRLTHERAARPRLAQDLTTPPYGHGRMTMRATTRLAHVLITLGLCATIAHGEPCRSGFDVAGAGTLSVHGHRRRVVQTAINGHCTFDVRLCANMGPDGC